MLQRCSISSCFCTPQLSSFLFFFFNDTATTEIYTLSLHDALPICLLERLRNGTLDAALMAMPDNQLADMLKEQGDRKSTRLNSSHVRISYAVFCLKKKNTNDYIADNCRAKRDEVAAVPHPRAFPSR